MYFETFGGPCSNPHSERAGGGEAACGTARRAPRPAFAGLGLFFLLGAYVGVYSEITCVIQNANYEGLSVDYERFIPTVRGYL